METKNNRDWIKDAVIYQIYPQSFCDSNGDGIGDLPGIISKLDYLADLGVNVLWINPCYDSPFNDAGYDVRDYYTIAKRYGTNADMERLCTEARKRGLRVCLDLVAGHTSIECEWFQKSAEPTPNPFSTYYIWTDHWEKSPAAGSWMRGYAPRNGNFLTNYFWSQPALNYGYAAPDPARPWEEPTDGTGPQAVIDELKKIMAFWLDLGCDGFRVDYAQSLVKNDPDQTASARLWDEQLLPWVRKKYPQAAMIAEWGDPAKAVGKAGFDIDFMLHFGVPGYGELFFKKTAVGGRRTHGPCYFSDEGKGNLTVFLNVYRKAGRASSGRGFIALPSSNHDFQRLNYTRSPEELKVAFVFLLTWNCIPAIYYGDEIGMRFLPDLPSKEGGYTRTGARTPMQWSDKPNAGFSSAPEKELYLPIDPGPDRPTVAAQQDDADSLLSFIRELLALRKQNPALRAGGTHKLLSNEDDPYPLVYSKSDRHNEWVIALNPSNKAVQQELALSQDQLHPVMSSGVNRSTSGTGALLSLGPVSWAIFKLEKSLS
jgi:maltose alpha-D-glucosyltransferase/alpha-amylase